MIQLPIVYVASKHSIPAQICLNTNTQNQSKCNNTHFNIRTNQNIKKNMQKLENSGQKVRQSWLVYFQQNIRP